MDNKDRIGRFSNSLRIKKLERGTIKCQICGEDRCVDLCHVIPHRKGGSMRKANTIYLCPNHHRLFDRRRLNYEEYKKVTLFYLLYLKSLAPKPKVKKPTIQFKTIELNEIEVNPDIYGYRKPITMTYSGNVNG